MDAGRAGGDRAGVRSALLAALLAAAVKGLEVTIVTTDFGVRK